MFFGWGGEVGRGPCTGGEACRMSAKEGTMSCLEPNFLRVCLVFEAAGYLFFVCGF